MIEMDIKSIDLHMCNESAASNFIKISKEKVVQLDLRPFLTQSQLNSGSETKWFTHNHLKELLQLLLPFLSSYHDCRVENDPKKSSISKDCILTGETIRVACLFKKQSAKNVCLMTNFCCNKKRGESGFSEVLLHEEKIVAYTCPRASSTKLHLSQLVVNVDSDKDGQHQDLSKYFHFK